MVTQATERLTLQLAAIERGSDVALGRLAETSDRSAATIDAVLQRSAEALDEIRGAIEVQAQAVAALVTQSEAGLGKVGLVAVSSLGLPESAWASVRPDAAIDFLTTATDVASMGIFLTLATLLI